MEYNVILDFKRAEILQTDIVFSQGDYGRAKLNISCRDNDVPIVDAESAEISFATPNGYLVTGSLEGSDGEYSYIFEGNEFQAAGIVISAVTLKWPDGRLSSCLFAFKCRQIPQMKPVDAGNYISELDKVIEDANEKIIEIQELIDQLTPEIGSTALVKADLYNGFDYTQVGLKAADAVAIKTLKDEQIQLTMTPVDCGSGESAKTFFDNLSSSMPDDTYYRKEIVIQPSAYEDFFAGRYYLEGMKKDSQNEWQKMISYTNSDVSFRKKGSSGWGEWNAFTMDGDALFSKGFTYNIDDIKNKAGVYGLGSSTPGTRPFDFGLIVNYARNENEKIQVAYATTPPFEIKRRMYVGSAWQDWDSVVMANSQSYQLTNPMLSSAIVFEKQGNIICVNTQGGDITPTQTGVSLLLGTIPVGMRPKNDISISCALYNGKTNNIYISKNGQVSAYVYEGGRQIFRYCFSYYSQ